MLIYRSLVPLRSLPQRPTNANYNKVQLMVQSSIAGAGRGVKLLANFNLNEIACRYYGTWSNKDSKNPYVFKYCDNQFLNGLQNTVHQYSMGQYINDPVDDEEVNFRLEVVQNGQGGLEPLLNVVCKQPEKSRKGAEIFVSYGADYWMSRENWSKLSYESKFYLRWQYQTDWKAKSAVLDLRLE